MAVLPIYALISLLSFIYQLSAVPTVIHIGGIGPKFTTLKVVNAEGTHDIASFIMALREINNKSDGVLDWVLPATQLRLAFKSPRQNFLEYQAKNLCLMVLAC